MSTRDPSFVVKCTGHEGVRIHTEYVFRVRHVGGCEWTVQRRYQELLDLHERLCAVFGAVVLPHFPPRTSPMTAVVKLFGLSSWDEVVADREKTFQKYFDVLCGCDGITRTPCFQAALAVVPPEPVTHLRVSGWVPAAADSEFVTALVDIRPEFQEVGSSAVVEDFRIIARHACDPGGLEEPRVLADFRIPAYGISTLARVEGLRPASQVELEVCATNAVGQSMPVTIRLIVPERRPAGLVDITEELSTRSSPRTPTEPGSVKGSQQELLQRQIEMELWWAERRLEAERADAARERQMAEFRAQRAALLEEQEEFERRRRSEQPSTAVSYHEARPVDPSAGSSGDALPGALWDRLWAKQEQLAEQWAALQLARDHQCMEAAQAARDRERWAEAAHAAQAELERRLEGATAPGADRSGEADVAALQAELAQQRLELDRQREEHHADAARAAAEAAQLAAAAESRQAEFEHRISELRALEAEREAAMERSEAQQRRDREALQTEREELHRQLEEQRAAAQASEAACAAQVKELAMQQAYLEKQRLAVDEDGRASRETPRLVQLERLRAEQAELEQRLADLTRERTRAEEVWTEQAEELREAELVMQRRAERLQRTEQLLLQERQELTRSRASLAVVQAHVVSMLDKADGAHRVSTHRLDLPGEGDLSQDVLSEPDQEDDEHPDRGKLDEVWEKDWTSTSFLRNLERGRTDADALDPGD